MIPTYLKPLRRKIGVVTLIVACVLMGGWLRSTLVKDHLTRDFGDGSTIHAVWYDGPCGAVARKGSSSSGRVQIRLLQSTVESIHGWAAEGAGWAWYQLGFGVIDERFEGGHLKGWFAHYWSIAIPMTLLSAWLLLSKPRKSIQKKTIEPISETVA